jgi:cupin fold WbuC family metalloprotein
MNHPNRDRGKNIDGHKIIDQELIKSVINKAHDSTRRRAPILLHNSYSDMPQRFVNCLCPMTYIRPHKHLSSQHWEIKSWLLGKIILLIFDECGTVTHKFHMTENEMRVIEIPFNQYHSLVTDIPSAYLEIRNCRYHPESDRLYADWSPEEKHPFAAQYVNLLLNASVGDKLSFENGKF